MIKKVFRLNQNEVKKVLKYGKPFFSYWIIMNQVENNLLYNRFAIIISEKSVINNVSRIFFRRLFYDLVRININSVKWKDLVFIVKKQIKLDKKDSLSIKAFENDILFLLKKINYER